MINNNEDFKKEYERWQNNGNWRDYIEPPIKKYVPKPYVDEEYTRRIEELKRQIEKEREKNEICRICGVSSKNGPVRILGRVCESCRQKMEE